MAQPSAPVGSSLNQLIQQRRHAEGERRQKDEISVKRDALQAREEELDRRELALFKAEIDLVRRIENDVREKENALRRQEDERRLEEDARRQREDQRRRDEDARRHQEDEEVKVKSAIVKAHEYRRTEQAARIQHQENRRKLQDRCRKLEEMLVHHQLQDPTVVDFAPLLLDRIDAVVGQNAEIDDLDCLFALVISDGSTKLQPDAAAAATKAQQAHHSVPVEKQSSLVSSVVPISESPAAKSSSSSTSKSAHKVTLHNDEDDEFFLLDDSPASPPRKTPQKPEQPKTTFIHRALSSPVAALSSPQSKKEASFEPPSIQSSTSQDAARMPQKRESAQLPAASAASVVTGARVFANLESSDISSPESSADWVMLDVTEEEIEPQNKKGRISIIRKIQQHLLGSSKDIQQPAKRATQEPPATLSRTEAFKAARNAAIAKHNTKIQAQIERLLPNVEKLAESDGTFDPIANFDSWNPLKKLVISTKETWDACGECGEYFDMLSIKHNCRLCLKPVCSKCGLERKTFPPTLVGVSAPRNMSVEAKCCRSCRIAISALERQQHLQKVRTNPRFSGLAAKYEHISGLKEKVLARVAVLDQIVAEIGSRDLSSSSSSSSLSSPAAPVPVEKLRLIAKSEQELVSTLQEYQDAMNIISRELDAISRSSGGTAVQPGQQQPLPRVETAEYRSLAFLRQSMIVFLTENRRLISHYKVLKESLGADPEPAPKPHDAPSKSEQQSSSHVPAQPKPQPTAPVTAPAPQQVHSQTAPQPLPSQQPASVPIAKTMPPSEPSTALETQPPTPARPKSPPPPYPGFK